MARIEPAAPAGRRAGGPGRIVRFAVYGAVLLFVLIGVPLYVLPPQELPAHGSVALVPADAQPWQIEWGQQLLASDRVDGLLIAVAAGAEPPSTCDGTPAVRCSTVASYAIRDSLRLLQAGAASRNAPAVVLTTTPQIQRTRLTISRCFASSVGTVDVVGRATEIDLRGWIVNYLRQTVGIGRLVVAPSC